MPDRAGQVDDLDRDHAVGVGAGVGRDQCVREPEANRFGEPMADRVNATDLTGQADFADGDQARGQRAIGYRAGDGEGRPRGRSPARSTARRRRSR